MILLGLQPSGCCRISQPSTIFPGNLWQWKIAQLFLFDEDFQCHMALPMRQSPSSKDGRSCPMASRASCGVTRPLGPGRSGNIRCSVAFPTKRTVKNGDFNHQRIICKCVSDLSPKTEGARLHLEISQFQNILLFCR